MADPIQIIDATQLATYLGFDPIAQHDVYVELANDLVTEAWADPDPDNIPAWVRGIALEAAARAARNPRGLESWTRSIDDGSRTERLPKDAARAGVFLTEDERVRLGRVGTKRSRFGSVRTRVGY
jgi:hypothetical protein